MQSRPSTAAAVTRGEPVTMGGSTLSSFTDDAARARFLAAYDRAMALWPDEREERDVPTRFGTTRVYVHGKGEGTPPRPAARGERDTGRPGLRRRRPRRGPHRPGRRPPRRAGPQRPDGADPHGGLRRGLAGGAPGRAGPGPGPPGRPVLRRLAGAQPGRAPPRPARLRHPGRPGLRPGPAAGRDRAGRGACDTGGGAEPPSSGVPRGGGGGERSVTAPGIRAPKGRGAVT